MVGAGVAEPRRVGRHERRRVAQQARFDLQRTGGRQPRPLALAGRGCARGGREPLTREMELALQVLRCPLELRARGVHRLPLGRRVGERLLRVGQLGRGAGQDFNQPRLVIGVVFQTLADCLAQMIEGSLNQRRQRAAVAAFAPFRAAPAIYALAQRAQPLKHNVDQFAIAFQVSATFVGDGVELLRAFRRSGDVTGFLEKGQRRIDDAGARRIPLGGLFLDQLDDLIAVARLLFDQCERDQS